MTFGVEKATMVWLPDGEKNLKIRLLVLTESTNVTDGQTDTACRRLRSIALQKTSNNRIIRFLPRDAYA